MRHSIRWTWFLAITLVGSTGIAREKAPGKADAPCAGRIEACEFYEAPALVITRHGAVIAPESATKPDPRLVAEEMLDRVFSQSRDLIAQILEDPELRIPVIVQATPDAGRNPGAFGSDDPGHAFWALLLAR